MGRLNRTSSIGIESYDWEMFEPLREETPYRDQRQGHRTRERRLTGHGRPHDRIQFQFEVADPDGSLAARSTITWHYGRSSFGMKVNVGDAVPDWLMESVRPERMRTMAAILRDPNPVHWDREAVAKLGFGHRTINQGPLGLSYMVNMLHAWAGPGCIKRLYMTFPMAVLRWRPGRGAGRGHGGA